MTYQVKLEVFEGPFDLLLQLIARRQVDVAEVDLSEITADFLAHLDAELEELDLETATRFLVVAATLVELKAARLLPADDRRELEDLLGEVRDVLYARLLEYRAFRDVARILDHRLTRTEWSLAREVPLEPWVSRLVPRTALPIDPAGLAALAAGAMTPTPHQPVDLAHIRRSYLTIREAAVQVLAALDESGSASYARLVAGRDRGDRVAVFLALLELFKLGHVDLTQPDHRGALAIARLPGASAHEVIGQLEPIDESDGSQQQDPQRPDAEEAVTAGLAAGEVHA